MSQTSPLLGLPYLEAAQAQKHVTHNEALRRLDAIVQLAVIDRDLAAPPPTPLEGDRYIVAAGASGAWAGRAGQVAAWQDGAWAFFAPAAGWLAWVADEGMLLAYVSGGWTAAGDGGGGSESLPLFGVNTIADAANRLAVKSDAILLSHNDVTPGSGDVRMVMNKAGASHTASLLLQSNASGRAEMGLTGDNKLHLKVSADGAAWTEAMVVDQATGYAGFGTSAPAGQLHVLRTGQAASILESVNNTSTSASFFTRKARGTPASRAAVNNLDYIIHDAAYAYDGSTYVSCANRYVYVRGTVSAGIVPTEQAFTTMDTAGAHATRLMIQPSGNTLPGADNAYAFGAGSLRWSAVWAATGTIQTSDARDKDVIGGLDFAGAMVDAVAPVLFRWKVGGNEIRNSETETATDGEGREIPAIEIVAKPGVRAHSGFLAQDIKAAMDEAGVDFGAWGLEQADDPDSRQFMRPDQLVAVLWAALKETRAKVQALEARLS
jgi:hypothetical protein